MTTRQHTIPFTSGSGDQHPVAPNIRNDQEGDEARSQQRTLSLSPLPWRRCSSTPPIHHTSTRRVVYRQKQQLPRHVGHDEETPLAGAFDRASETRAGDSFYHRGRQRQSVATSPQPRATHLYVVPPHPTPPQLQLGGARLADGTAIIRAIRAPVPLLPTFSGQDQEDPHAFLRDCEEHFAHSATEMSQWTRLAGGALKDTAGKW